MNPLVSSLTRPRRPLPPRRLRRHRPLVIHQSLRQQIQKKIGVGRNRSTARHTVTNGEESGE